VTPTPIRTFRANLRDFLSRAARGESFTITYRGAPIAEINPVGTAAKATAPAATAPGSTPDR
jgi:prevent-host-death family protein